MQCWDGLYTNGHSRNPGYKALYFNLDFTTAVAVTWILVYARATLGAAVRDTFMTMVITRMYNRPFIHTLYILCIYHVDACYIPRRPFSTAYGPAPPA